MGRISFELSQYFKKTVGIDYTTRFIQMATKLKEDLSLSYKDINIDIKGPKLDVNSIEFWQMNPENPDDNKLNGFDWIVLDGYALRKGSVKNVLQKIIRLAAQQALIAIINAPGVNQVSQDEVKEVLDG